MNIFGLSIVKASVMEEITNKAVSTGSWEDKTHDLQNRVNSLKGHKKTLMGDREWLEGKYERIKAYNGILQDESVRLKAEIQEITVSGGKGVAMMAKKIQTQGDIIENQAGIIKEKGDRIEDFIDAIDRRDVEIEKLGALNTGLTKTIKDQAHDKTTQEERAIRQVLKEVCAAVKSTTDDIEHYFLSGRK